MRALGLDACKKGWMAVLMVDGKIADRQVFDRFTSAITELQPDRVGVDIPIGLVNAPDRWADVAARAYLAGNKSTVFNAPPRAVLDAYQDDPDLPVTEARRIAEKRIHKGLTSQSFGILKTIAEVHGAQAELTMPVLEIHPEVSFQALQPGKALPRKKSWNGVVARTRLLEGLGIGFTFDMVAEAGELADVDDLLDATVAAFTAAQPHQALTALDGSAAPLNETPQRDPKSGPIAIWRV